MLLNGLSNAPMGSRSRSADAAAVPLYNSDVASFSSDASRALAYPAPMILYLHLRPDCSLAGPFSLPLPEVPSVQVADTAACVTPLRGDKGSSGEGGIRIPALAQRRASSLSASLVVCSTSTDFLPTALSLAGVSGAKLAEKLPSAVCQHTTVPISRDEPGHFGPGRSRYESILRRAGPTPGSGKSHPRPIARRPVEWR